MSDPSAIPSSSPPPGADAPERPGVLGSAEQGSAPPPAAAPGTRAPGRRVTMALAAGMLVIGLAVGAAIGPAPSPSLAVGRLLPLLPSLLDSAGQAAQPVKPPASVAQATPSAETEVEGPTRHRRRRKRHKGSIEAETSAVGEAGAAPSEASTPTANPKAKPKALAPVSKVWLVELANASFSEAAADAADAPYLEGTALPQGTLLAGWSALEGSTFASDAALIAGGPPQLLDTIVQPPCPEGAAGASCAAGTPGAVKAADEFLQATLPTITSTSGYRENGLIVVTFTSISAASASGLPAGAASSTLTSESPTGVLLLSPFVAAGAKSTAALNPTSPRQSLEKLLRR